MTNNSSLLISDAHGIYIPQFFAESFSQYLTNKEELTEALADLSTPDNEYYWESWETVLDSAKLKDDDGRECILWQDGNLWAIPVNELDQIPED